jgi:hypothetical protein
MAMDTSAKALVEHWKWAAQKGLMNGTTARIMGNACSQVLSALDDWPQLDVNGMDPDEIFRRFQNLRSKDLTPRSLSDYRRRFKQALESFREYIADPTAWKGPGQERRARQPQLDGASEKPLKKQATVRPPPQTRTGRVEAPELIEYPYPLRSDLMVRILLPRDLRLIEAKRLGSYITTLAVDFGEQNWTALPRTASVEVED